MPNNNDTVYRPATATVQRRLAIHRCLIRRIQAGPGKEDEADRTAVKDLLASGKRQAMQRRLDHLLQQRKGKSK
jgi:hypothetical protein